MTRRLRIEKGSAMRPMSRNLAKPHGFTLIEMMIVVAVIAILAAVAYPSYQEHVAKSRRAAAQGCLVEYAQFMERFYTTNMRYNQTSGASPVAVSLPATSCSNDLANFYSFVFADSQPTASTYTIEARPQGSQATVDAGCGTLSLTHTGVKGRSGSADLNACWR